LTSRAYHIAFEKGIGMKILMGIAARAGVSIKNHMSPIEAEEEQRLRGAVDRLKEEFLEDPEKAMHVEVPEVPAEEEPPVMMPGEVVEPAPVVQEAPPKEAPPAAEAEEKEREEKREKPTVPPPQEKEKAVLEEKIKEKSATRKKKRIREEGKPMDSAEILEELKGRFLSDAMKGLVTPGRRPVRPRAGRGRRISRGPSRRSSKPLQAPAQADREVEVQLPVTVKDLSKAIGIKANMIQKRLMEDGAMLKLNDPLSEDLIELVAMEFDRQVQVRKPKDVEDLVQAKVEATGKEENLIPRAPVVTFLGHVDHGKTSLLDRIRKTKVAEGEAGGITQHMSAYRLEHQGKPVTFLDTPGHEAFTDMRARGAQVTDIVVLVVAADDGVMPQTEEAINHARAAEVPIIVALNKVDKPDANPMRAKQQLAGLGLNPEEWGGDTVVVETSAVTGQGLSELLEMLNLVAELQDFKADPTLPAQGTVLEANVHEGRGPLATVIITQGTLHIGDVMLAGSTFGRVRALYDDRGRSVETGAPSEPLEIAGFNELPGTGDRLVVMDEEVSARAVAEERERRDRSTTVRKHVTLDNLFTRLEEGEVKEVRLVLKADGQGSLAALQEQLLGLSTPEVKVRILHAGVGGINESDVLLAHASDAIIAGFHVVPSEKARLLGRDQGVDIRLFNVIYQLIDDVRSALEGTLEPEKVEEVKGHVEVRQVFRISRIGNIAGCFVRDGRIERNDKIRLIRNDVVVLDEARIDSLKRHKDDVKEVKEGFECGIKIAGYDDVKVGDVIESFVIKLVPRKLSLSEQG